MPKVRISVPSQIPQEEALNRIKARVAQIKTQYGDQVSDLMESWNGYVGKFNGSARGFAVSGSIAVDPSATTVEFALPLLALPFKGRVEAAIRKDLTTLLT